MINATISGGLGKDAEIRNAGGQELASFSVASSSKVKGEKVTTWVDCTIWGRRGAALVQYLTKGTRVVVVGELSTREHNGKTYLQCKVDQIELMGGGQRGGLSGSRSESGNRGYGADDGYDDAVGDDSEIPF